MTSREIDMFFIGCAVAFPVGLWLGYRLRASVETLREARRARDHERALGRAWRDHAKHTPFGDLSEVPRSEQDARAVLKKPRKIPLEKRPASPSGERIPIIRDPDKVPVVPIPTARRFVRVGADEFVDVSDVKTEAAATARQIREDAIAALTGAGYKRAAAEIALDACSLVERAGGLESWIAAAFRHLAASKT